MKIKLHEILGRIESIDRDVGELNSIKSKLPENKSYSSSLHVAFDQQINKLLSEKGSLMETVIEDPPAWIIEELNKRGNITVKSLPATLHGDLSIANPSEKDIISFIQSLPKTEVHLHLEACVNRQTIKHLIRKNNLKVTDEELENVFNFEGLNGFIGVFYFIQNLIRSTDDLKYMIDSLAEYLRSDNIIYAEVFFAPTKFMQNGLDFFQMMEVIVKRIREIKNQDGTEIKVIVDVSRSFGTDNAMLNLKNVLKLKYKEVIGIGLGGAETKGPARDFASVFQLAKDSGLRVVAHSGEDDGPWEIWDAIKLLGVERIGHGVSAVQDPKLLDYLKETRIPIEICLTSNIFTGKYVRREHFHPVRQYYDKDIMLCINTDDPEIFNVNLSSEFFKLYRYLNFTIPEIISLVKKGVYSTFSEDKESLWKRVEAGINKSKLNFKLQ